MTLGLFGAVAADVGVSGAQASRGRRAQSARAPERWRLTWQDDFTGGAGTRPDTTVWSPQLGDGCDRGICGWGNSERQTYTNTLANAALNGRGQLAITARVESTGATCWYGPCRYTSARFVTTSKVEATHGRVEARIKLPNGQGVWPAFWMLGAGYPTTPWPACGEVDIMEFRGSLPMETSSALHGPGYAGNTPFSRRWRLPQSTFSSDYHLFGVEWSRDSLAFTVDSVVTLAVTRAEVEAKGQWVFDGAFRLLLNVAVGGHFDGDPASDAVLPATMLVDYVRVYTRRR
jgi:beta-glucanase (GH16 family)